MGPGPKGVIVGAPLRKKTILRTWFGLRVTARKRRASATIAIWTAVGAVEGRKPQRFNLLAIIFDPRFVALQSKVFCRFFKLPEYSSKF